MPCKDTRVHVYKATSRTCARRRPRQIHASCSGSPGETTAQPCPWTPLPRARVARWQAMRMCAMPPLPRPPLRDAHASRSPTPTTPAWQALGGTPGETTPSVRRSASRCELPPARSSATAADLARLPESWRAAYEPMQRPLRAAQAHLLAEACPGRDYVGIAATGSGKGVVWLVPAAAEARDALRGTAPRALSPLSLVVVPLSAQGPVPSCRRSALRAGETTPVATGESVHLGKATPGRRRGPVGGPSRPF